MGEGNPPVVRASTPLDGPPRAGANVAITPNRVRIGYVYVAKVTTQDGTVQVYTGSTGQELIKRLSAQHDRKKFLSDPNVEIEIHAVDARLDVSASGRQTLRSARNEALRAAEQTKISEVGDIPGVKTINDIAAATRDNQAKWTAAHDVTLAEITEETAPRYVVRLAERWIFKGPLIGKMFAGFDLLTVFLMYRDIKTSQYVMAPYVLQDEGGVFTLHWERDGWLSATRYWKHYEKGARAGQDIDIDSSEYDFWKDEAEALWGYLDWLGDFVPGLLRRELPVIDPDEA